MLGSLKLWLLQFIYKNPQSTNDPTATEEVTPQNGMAAWRTDSLLADVSQTLDPSAHESQLESWLLQHSYGEFDQKRVREGLYLNCSSVWPLLSIPSRINLRCLS
jgi:hypothetical protein